MNHWHLIYTKPHQEKVAFDNLTHQNYQCYLPLINTEKILRGKKILIKEPMFPRYLFVRLSHDGQQNWSPIRSSKGVSHLVNFGGLAASFDDETMDNLQQKIDKTLQIVYQTLSKYTFIERYKLLFGKTLKNFTHL